MKKIKKILTGTLLTAISLTTIGCGTSENKLAKNIDKSMADFVSSINKLDYVETTKTASEKIGKIVETNATASEYSLKTVTPTKRIRSGQNSLNYLNEKVSENDIENTITKPSERRGDFSLFILSDIPFVTLSSDDNETRLNMHFKFSTNKIEETSTEIDNKINSLILKRSILLIYVNEIYNGKVNFSEENKVAINAYLNVIKENTSFLNGNRGMVKNQLSLAGNLVKNEKNDDLINYYIIKSGEALETRANKIDSAISAIDSIIAIIENNLTDSSSYYNVKLSGTYNDIISDLNKSTDTNMQITKDSSNKDIAKSIYDSLGLCENCKNETDTDQIGKLPSANGTESEQNTAQNGQNNSVNSGINSTVNRQNTSAGNTTINNSQTANKNNGLNQNSNTLNGTQKIITNSNGIPGINQQNGTIGTGTDKANNQYINNGINSENTNGRTNTTYRPNNTVNNSNSNLINSNNNLSNSNNQINNSNSNLINSNNNSNSSINNTNNNLNNSISSGRVNNSSSTGIEHNSIAGRNQNIILNKQNGGNSNRTGGVNDGNYRTQNMPGHITKDIRDEDLINQNNSRGITTYPAHENTNTTISKNNTNGAENSHGIRRIPTNRKIASLNRTPRSSSDSDMVNSGNTSSSNGSTRLNNQTNSNGGITSNNSDSSNSGIKTLEENKYQRIKSERNSNSNNDRPTTLELTDEPRYISSQISADTHAVRVPYKKTAQIKK